MKPTFDELQSRIASHAADCGGTLTERSAIAWSGYLAGLLEWNLLSVSDHQRLLKLLPAVDDDPVVAILLGSPNES